MLTETRWMTRTALDMIRVMVRTENTMTTRVGIDPCLVQQKSQNRLQRECVAETIPDHQDPKSETLMGMLPPPTNPNIRHLRN